MADTPEIKIGADLSAVEKAVDDLGKKVVEVSKPIDVVVNTDSAEKALDALAETAGKVDQAAALPASAAGASKLAAELEKARKVQATLAREGIKISRDQAAAAQKQLEILQRGNARGTRRLQGRSLDEILDGGSKGFSVNAREGARMRADLLRSVGLGDALPPNGGGGDGKQPRSLSAFAGDALRRTGRGVASQMLPNTGLGGTIAAQGVSEAAGAGGIMSGAGLARIGAGLGIGALAYGAMKLVGGVTGKVGTAQDEGMARSDMVRSIGWTVEEFDSLRESAQALAHGLSITAGDATALARAYGSASAMTQSDRGRIFSEAASAGSLARQTGLDVGQTVGQFAELRRTGQDTPDKMGRAIADAISKRGDFGRLSEVIGNLTSFSSTVANASLTRGNTDNVLDVASRLASLNLPGLGTAEGVGHAAAMDAGFRGGAGGEAGDLLLQQNLLRSGLPVNGYDIKSVREAGLFANLGDVFGPNSPQGKAAAARGDTRESARLAQLAGGGGTVLDRVFDSIKRQYATPAEQSSALQGITGGSQADAYALMASMSRGGAGGVLSALKGAGIDTSNMSVAQMIQANGALNMSPDDLQKRRAELLARTGVDKLSDDDARSLRGAGSTDDLRKAIVSIASKETIQTEGERTRASLSTIQQVLENWGAKLAAILEPLRDAAVKLAVKFGAIDQDQADKLMGITQLTKLRAARAETAQELETAKQASPYAIGARGVPIDNTKANAARVDALTRQLAAQDDAISKEEKASQNAADPGSPQAQAAAADDKRRDWNVAALASRASPWDSTFKESAKKYGVDATDLKLLAAREAGMNPTATHLNANGTTDYGIMQHNSAFLAERGLSVDDALNPEKAIPAAAKLWKQFLDEAHGDKRAAFKRYNGTGPAADDYAAHQMAARALIDAQGDAKMPAVGDTRGPTAEKAAKRMENDAGPTVKHAHSLAITLQDRLGGTIADIPEMNLHDGEPLPAGLGPRK